MRLQTRNNVARSDFAVVADPEKTGLKVNGGKQMGGLAYTLYYKSGFWEGLRESLDFRN